MVAVLVDSRKDGETAWVATRGLTRVRVSGMAGCGIVVCSMPDDLPVLVVDQDGEFSLPEGAEMVKVVHSEVNGESRVFVDLIGE